MFTTPFLQSIFEANIQWCLALQWTTCNELSGSLSLWWLCSKVECKRPVVENCLFTKYWKYYIILSVMLSPVSIIFLSLHFNADLSHLTHTSLSKLPLLHMSSSTVTSSLILTGSQLSLSGCLNLTELELFAASGCFSLVPSPFLRVLSAPSDGGCLKPRERGWGQDYGCLLDLSNCASFSSQFLSPVKHRVQGVCSPPCSRSENIHSHLLQYTW